MSSRLLKEDDVIRALHEQRCLFRSDKDAQRFAVIVEDIPAADRPQGDVDAVDILMREMHNLDQGYITIGEFDERIEPLRHLCYGRPQGWIPCNERMPEEEGIYLVTATNCIFDTEEIAVGTCYFNIGYGFSNNRKILAWMPLPQPWKGADDEAD